MESLFLDTLEGLAPSCYPKHYRQSFMAIVMELLEGSSVEEKWASLGRDTSEDMEAAAADIFRRILHAVNSIHDHGYIHR